jgi:hypothetical protein
MGGCDGQVAVSAEGTEQYHLPSRAHPATMAVAWLISFCTIFM